MRHVTALLLALQRVVYERPPAGVLRRGLVALPRAPTVVAVVALTALLVGYALRARYARKR